MRVPGSFWRLLVLCTMLLVAFIAASALTHEQALPLTADTACEAALDQLSGDSTCYKRTDWLFMRREGWSISKTQRQIAVSHPECDLSRKLRCDPYARCRVALARDVKGASCGARIEWLVREKGHSVEEAVNDTLRHFPHKCDDVRRHSCDYRSVCQAALYSFDATGATCIDRIKWLVRNEGKSVQEAIEATAHHEECHLLAPAEMGWGRGHSGCAAGVTAHMRPPDKDRGDVNQQTRHPEASVLRRHPTPTSMAPSPSA